MKQFNNLVEFRQAVYEHGLIKARDAQFELVEALLMGSPIRSFPELSLSPVFRRKWPSAYAAIEDGEQDRRWLEKLFVGQIPAEGTQVFSLDGTAWPHPEARVLADRQYVYSGGEIALNFSYDRYLIFRNFEVPACGPLLVTEDVPELERFFDPGKEVVVFGSLGDLREKLDYYLAHPGEAQDIARRGLGRAHTEHTFVQRMGELLDKVFRT